MKCTIPEISWHNRDPVLSLDFQPNKGNEQFHRLATGGTDSHVLIWLLTPGKGVPSLECTADLTRHTKPVNCVRFSPSGEILASGDDESCIILWKMKTSSDPPEIFNSEEESYKEQWTSVKVLRGHLQDVYDLSWSADSKNLISGSVDNTAILWDVSSGKNLGILTEHKGFVQGVAWDPCGKYVATISSDRACRVYNIASRRVVSKMYKGHLPSRSQDADNKPVHYFHDDTFKSFFRRLTFTPDGQLLIVPSGIVEEPGSKLTNSTIIFHRSCLQKPVVYLPSLSQYSVAVRCCPVYFTLRQTDSPPMFSLPYRMVIAVATQSNVVLYDTQQAAPFAFVSNIHYTRLSDLSWSQDGRVIVVSSTDGYCSVITFAENELGTVYTGEETQQSDQTPAKSEATGNKQSEQHQKASENSFSLSEDANMPFNESNKKAKDPLEEEDSNKKTTVRNKTNDLNPKTASKNEESPMEVDDFSLVYEGTIGEPVLEPKSDNNKENKALETTIESEKLVKDSKNDLKDDSKNSANLSNDSENRLKCKENTKGEESPKKCNDTTKIMQEEALTSPKSGVNVTPGSSYKKTPRRVQLITLSSPKSKKKLLE